MALTIENATEGYDSSNLNALKEEIKTACIDPAIDDLGKGLEDLKNAIDQIWVGDSANRFKDKMENHISNAQKLMRTVKSDVELYLGNITVQLREVDESIDLS